MSACIILVNHKLVFYLCDEAKTKQTELVKFPYGEWDLFVLQTLFWIQRDLVPSDLVDLVLNTVKGKFLNKNSDFSTESEVRPTTDSKLLGMTRGGVVGTISAV